MLRVFYRVLIGLAETLNPKTLKCRICKSRPKGTYKPYSQGQAPETNGGEWFCLGPGLDTDLQYLKLSYILLYHTTLHYTI